MFLPCGVGAKFDAWLGLKVVVVIISGKGFWVVYPLYDGSFSLSIYKMMGILRSACDAKFILLFCKCTFFIAALLIFMHVLVCQYCKTKGRKLKFEDSTM